MTHLRNVHLHVITSVIIFTLLMITAASAPLRAQGTRDTATQRAATDVHFHKFQPKVSPDAASTSAVTRTQSEIDAFIGQQIGLLEQEKATRTPAQQKIDSNVLYTIRMMQGQAPAPGIPSLYTGVDLDDNNNMAVDITANVTDELLQKLQSVGALILYSNAGYRSIRAIIPPNQIEGIAASPDVTFIAPKVGSLTSHIDRDSRGTALDRWRTVPGFAKREAKVRKALSSLLQKTNTILTGSGSVDTEGDITHRAFDARGTFGVNGAGLKIGVLSDSANATGALTSAQGTGDMPPTCPGPGGPCVTVVNDFGFGGDEGTAMMEIIFDMAPGASLFFETADLSEASFANNILDLRNVQNCDIIVDDVFYFDEPVFQDGIVAQAVTTVVTSGALYFSSAGNEGNLDSAALGFAGYFEGDFNDAGSAVFPGSVKAGTIHNFGTVGSPVNGDILQFVGDAYTLNWADPFPTPLNPTLGSSNDYDLFLVNSTGTIKVSSTNLQTGTQKPFESINPPAFVAGDRLVVFKTTAAAVRAFSLNTIRGTLTVVTTGQTHGHSAVAAVGEFSVAAAPAAGAFAPGAPVGPFPNPFTAANQVEPYTSDGPRRVFFNADGTPITPGSFTFASNGFATRNKPDITAADGVSTTLPPGSGLNPFYGTSAAAPHAAAIAALVKSANPALTQAQIQTALFGTALDIMAAGYDRDSGNGIVMAYQAVASLGISGQANPEIASVVPSQNPGNGDGIIKAGEGAKVVIQLQNLSGVLNATGITATLTSTTAGITVLSPNTSAYTNINAGLSGGTNLTPFKFVLASSFGCATTINFTLTVNYSSGQQRILNFTVPTGTINFANNLGTLPTAITGFTTATGTQTGRVLRDGTPSVCGVPKAFPGVGSPLNGCATCTFDSYTFTPQASGCVNSTLTTNTNNIFEAVYAGTFTPSSIGTNYTADAGFGFTTETCGLQLVAGTSYTFVVSDESGTSVGTPYTLSLPACSILGTINQVPVAIVHDVTVASAVVGGSANASIDNGSNDPDGNPVTIVQTPAGPYPHGVTSVLLTITDSFGAAAQASANVTVVNPGPDLTITKIHSGNFTQGQVGATYTITATNSGGTSTTAAVSVVDTLPTGLTATALAGTGWGCTLGTLTCTRADALAGGANYPAITLTVTVAGNAPATVTNTATVSGGGETVTTNDVANDLTTVVPALPDLTITKTHIGNFTQGQVGATYTITVTNSGTAATSAQVNVVDTLPAPLTATAISGTGWTCVLATFSCNRSDALAPSASYPAITLTVTVAANAAASVTNTATVSGGGETNVANDVANDVTTIVQLADLTIVKAHAGNFIQGQVGATYTITVTNSGNGPTSGQVNVVDTLPAGLTATALAGTGWTCVVATVSCNRNDALAAAGSYPVITLTVTVAGNAAASVTNSVVVSGGGEIIVNNDTANNPTTILTSPTANLSTNSLTFPITTVGTPSSAMPVTVTNNGQAPLNFTVAPAFSGTNSTDFVVANTSTCVVGTPVAGGGSCVFNIVFTAGAAGPRGPATVTFTDNASPTTQAVTPLNGSGADFGESGPGSAVTVAAGSTANFTITITPGAGGFPNVITFSETGAPTTGTTVSFSPPNETPGNVVTTTTMMITTTSRAGITPGPGRRLPPGPLPLMLWTIAAAMLAASLLMMRKNNYRRRLAWAGMAAVLVLVVAGIAGCNSKTVNLNGTPAGTSNITVTATSGTLSHTTVVTMTVQ